MSFHISIIIDSVVRVWLLIWFLKEIPKKQNIGKELYFLISCATALIFTVIYQMRFNVYLTEAIRPMLLYLFVILCYEIDRNYAVYLCSLYTIICGIWGILFSPFLLYTVHLTQSTVIEGFENYRFLIISLFRIFTVLLLKRYALTVDCSRRLKPMQAIILLIPALINHFLFIWMYGLSMSAELQPYIQMHSFEFFGFMLCIVISTIFVLITSENFFHQQEIEVRILNNQRLLEQEYLIYQRNQANNKAVREVYHDLRNHISMLENMETITEIKDYLNQLYAQIKPSEQYFNTGNMALDIILNQKYEEAKAKGVSLYSTMDFSNGSFLSDSEICSLFSNAFDNAIAAAAESLDDPKIVRAQSGCIGEFLSIRIENNVNPEYQLQLSASGTPISRKNGNHGIGTQSMKTVIDRWHGNISYNLSNHLFVVKILIPIPDVNNTTNRNSKSNGG